MMVRNTDFGRITELPRDLFIKGRAGFAFAFGVMTITGIGALQNHNWALPDPSAMQSNADLAHMEASIDPHSPVNGQLAAESFQSSAVENSGDKAIDKNGSTDPAPSTRQGNAHSAQGKSSLDSRYSIKDKSAANSFQSSADENTGHNALNLISDPSRNANSGWQYCLATSRADHKVYVSSPFPKTANLNVIAIAFSQRLVELHHEAVQCPVSKYKGSIATMREDAIRLQPQNRKYDRYTKLAAVFPLRRRRSYRRNDLYGRRQRHELPTAPPPGNTVLRHRTRITRFIYQHHFQRAHRCTSMKLRLLKSCVNPKFNTALFNARTALTNLPY